MKKGIRFVIGMDLGDRWTSVSVLDRETGEETEALRVRTTRESMDELFAGRGRCRVVMESGTHSPWTSRAASRHGHEVIVADARRVRAVWDSPKKNDRRDALLLAELGASPRGLLKPVRHRGERAQSELALLRAREAVVDSRTALINAARGAVKAFGARLPSCSSASFHKRAKDALPEALRPALEPLLAAVAALTATIASCDAEVERLCALHPETARLRQVGGVGPVTSLAFALVVDDPARFARTRDVGAYLGVAPRQDQSGDCDKQLGITKCGDRLMRRLLVQCAHRVLGPFGTDCDLRRWGLELARRGGRNAKKRAVVAVARKLAVLLLALWKKDSDYVPLRTAAA